MATSQGRSMDVTTLHTRGFLMAALMAATASAQAAAPQPAASPLQRQARTLAALTSMADEASAGSVPNPDTLATGKFLAMVIADPALVPTGSAGMAAMEQSLSLCTNGNLAGKQLLRLAQATPDPEQSLGVLSDAVDRTGIMSIACSARQLDMMGRALLGRDTDGNTSAVLAGMQQMTDGMSFSIALVVLGATQTDASSAGNRASTLASALPVFREAAAAMTPAGRKTTLDAVKRALQKPEREGHIDRDARLKLEAALQTDACAASCQVLGKAIPATR